MNLYLVVVNIVCEIRYGLGHRFTIKWVDEFIARFGDEYRLRITYRAIRRRSRDLGVCFMVHKPNQRGKSLYCEMMRRDIRFEGSGEILGTW